ncbi:hypothetical protein M947_06595 [Sulfurimonas hongkongensis]|uniref:Protein containing prepilin-type N-cleavage/methylation domain protein n=1 Tax=Sulfurimonas hongkongensis TaxID=1172190 RepID=T0L1M4_9BACT|nr:type II secretion system protein [Sulfurimonas hongkongensis]EQB39658.1 hypothetical protein M947_06595 [Sulfurimonas hongkongensis]
MKNRFAFTMIELIFVIVIMGILAKFGVEFLAQAYNNFILSKTNNALQSQSAAAVETIASRLQYRIKDSIIARENALNFQALPSSTYGDNARVLEWVASDIEGFRGNKWPLWSGIIDLNASTATLLKSPETNTTALNAQIESLSYNDSTINDAALYFVGSDSDINGYGWGGAITDQNSVMHPIRAGSIDEFVPVRGDNGNANDFVGIDVYEYYQLAWTAYAVVHSADGNLTLHYDYQPWQGESYIGANTKRALIMQNVSTFRFKAIGSVVKIQVCVDGNITDGGYSICKEKTIF